MIISASRRTDIPAWYSDWFFNRLREGFVCVRNPMNFHQVSRVALSPDVVDGIVFWTKNPLPMLPKFEELRHYPYYVQFTVTPYGKDIEPNVPDKLNTIVPAFQKLARQIGPERIIWRYDPILLTDRYTADFHIESFRALAGRLAGYTRKCVISFVDLYRGTRARMDGLGFAPLAPAAMTQLARHLAVAARENGLVLETCAEQIDLKPFGIARGHCIDRALLEELAGCRLALDKDRNQRPECGCVSSVDIGQYDTCPHGCRYCYATHRAGAAARSAAVHDPRSPLLAGRLLSDDVVKDRAAASCRIPQLSLFD